MAEPKLVMKGNREFRHDLFHMSVEKAIRNDTFRKGVVVPRFVEHKHIFHTHNSAGKAQTYTNKVLGHYHEIKWKVDKDGELVATCGPAIRDTQVKRAGKIRTKRAQPVTWIDEENERLVTDDHKHKMTYEHSEYLSQNKIKAAQTAGQMIQQQQAKEAQLASDVGLEIRD